MKLAEWRVGRNFVRPGDIVKVLPPADRRGSSFQAVVREIVADDETGDVRWVEVLGGARGRVATHNIRPDRIKRLAQTKGGEKRERRR